MTKDYDIIIVGGGSAGLAAAISAYDYGVKNILILEKTPKMFTQIEKFDKTKRQYGRIVIDNYVILYTIDDEKKIIYIAHIYYQRRDYI